MSMMERIDDDITLAPEDAKEGISFFEADAVHCKFVLGDPRDLRVCGKPTAFDSSWCEEHHKALQIPAPARRNISPAFIDRR